MIFKSIFNILIFNMMVLFESEVVIVDVIGDDCCLFDGSGSLLSRISQ